MFIKRLFRKKNELQNKRLKAIEDFRKYDIQKLIDESRKFASYLIIDEEESILPYHIVWKFSERSSEVKNIERNFEKMRNEYLTLILQILNNEIEVDEFGNHYYINIRDIDKSNFLPLYVLYPEKSEDNKHFKFYFPFVCIELQVLSTFTEQELKKFYEKYPLRKGWSKIRPTILDKLKNIERFSDDE